MRSRWPRRAPRPCPAQDLYRLDADDLRGARPSSASTRPATSAATSCRARIATTRSGCASSNCAGTRGNRKPAYICESRHRDCRASTRRGCWSTANGARWHRGKTAGFHLSSLYSPVGLARGATSPPRGKPPSTRSRDRPPPSRPSRTPNWARPGSRKAKRPTGNGWSSAARTIGWAPCHWAACCWSARPTSEGSHRGLDLGLRARQGVLAHRAPRA